MGMLELIQQKAFLGKEFVTWLWYRAETNSKIELHQSKPVLIEMLGPIMLDAQYGDARVSTLRGDSPATSPEAHTALLEGKKLKKAKMKWTREDTEWVFALDGETFHLAGLAIPNAGKLPFEDYMALRLDMVIDYEQVLTGLLETFLELRLDSKAWGREIPHIQKWVKGK